MPSLRQLRYLVALDDRKHFGRAAEECHVSQPALSMQIRELEAELGLPLVERGRAAIDLTETGREIAERARLVLAGVRDIEGLARRRRGILVGPYALGLIPSVAPYLLPDLLPRLAHSFPELQLRVRETVTAGLLAELAEGRLDAAILALPAAGDFEQLSLFEDAFLLATRRGPATGPAEPVDAQAIAGETLLLLEEGHCLRDQALSFCAAISPRALSSFGATSLATLLQLVAAGHGVTFLPELAAAGLGDERIALRPITGARPARTIGLAWRTSSPRSADHRALADLIIQSRTGASPP